MLFHTFSSQEERRALGGGDFVELACCRLPRGTDLKTILSRYSFWSNDSLYICGDDMEDFCAAYGKIITGGMYGNLKAGPLDWCGVNCFSPEQASFIMDKIREEKPMDFEPLLSWLERETEFNGFYVLGL